MELPVYIEPSPGGFRATTGGPLDLTANGPTVDAAAAALQQLVTARLRAGQLRTLTVTGIDPILAAARVVGQNPLFENWVREVEEYRRAHNSPADTD
jgi:hypothetical protein